MKILSMKGQIEVLTGLHIGGGDDVMKIGGVDKPVIKETRNNKPYIPGSSLKGKMRSLLEWDCGLVGLNDGKPCSITEKKDGKEVNKHYPTEKEEQAALLIAKLFGNSVTIKDREIAEKVGITRISVGDCHLSDECNDMQLTEAKYENTIDRKTGVTTGGGVRQIERVPAGVKFNYDIRIKVLEGDDETALKAMVERGLELVAQDYLGGSGSRGYGRVKFHHESV